MKQFHKLIAVLLLLVATQVQADVVAGRDYKVMSPAQPTSSGSKVEVLEFFFYGCSHCYHLHGPLSAWEKKMPGDVELQSVPVIFRDTWEPMARTFYALEAIGEGKRLHDDLFDAWNVHNTDLSDEQKITTFVAKRGWMPKNSVRLITRSRSPARSRAATNWCAVMPFVAHPPSRWTENTSSPVWSRRTPSAC